MNAQRTGRCFTLRPSCSEKLFVKNDLAETPEQQRGQPLLGRGQPNGRATVPKLTKRIKPRRGAMCIGARRESREPGAQVARLNGNSGPVLETTRRERRRLARRVYDEEPGQPEVSECLTLVLLCRPLQYRDVSAVLRHREQGFSVHASDDTEVGLRQRQQTVSVVWLIRDLSLTTCRPDGDDKLVSMWPTLERPRPRLALTAGIIATLVLAAIVAPLHDHVTRALPALLLVVPVVATAVIGGRVPGFLVAAFATLAFSFALPPIGSPRIRLSEDVLALVVFSAVAFVVSALVTTKVKALENIDDQRRALLRSVSHDLRTPLAAILAVATDLRAGTDYDQGTRDEVLDLLIDETERLDRLVANLLSMSRVEAGTLQPRLAEVDVAELVASSAHRLERLFTRWKLEVDVSADLPLLRADPAQLEEVCNNLLENAVRHTPEGTCVRVSARTRGDLVEITFSDNGPGLPPEIADRLRTSKLDAGQGLGLAICQAIVTLHGGTLRLADHHLGTSIAVTVPCIS